MCLGQEYDGDNTSDYFNGYYYQAVFYEGVVGITDAFKSNKGKLYSLIEGKNPLAFIPVDSATLNPVGSLNLTATWQDGVPLFTTENEFTFAELTGNEWVKLEGSGSTSGDRTIEVLAQVDEYTTWSRLFELGDSSKTALASICISDEGDLLARVRDGSSSTAQAITYTDRPEIGEVCHITGVYNDSEGVMRLYKNGQLIVVGDAVSINSTTPNTLGNLFYSLWAQVGTSSDEKFVGRCAYVAYYNQAFTASEVTAHYTYAMSPSGNDFLPMGEVPEGLVYPVGASVSTTVGTGILNSSGSPVYLKSSENIARGETKHIITEDLSVNATLVFDDNGLFTLTEGANVTNGSSSLDLVALKYQNGQLFVTDDESDYILKSVMFDYSAVFASVEVLDGETIDKLDANVFYPHSDTIMLYCAGDFPFVTWANKETVAQANPQPEQLQILDPPTPKVNVVANNNPFCADPVVDENGKQRKYGYIESTVTLSGVPAENKRVLCYDQSGSHLIAETRSGSDGSYRFDSLLLGKKYMIIAQYGEVGATSAPDYLPSATDWQSPTAY